MGEGVSKVKVDSTGIEAPVTVAYLLKALIPMAILELVVALY